jgi:hypothetical protein
MTRDSPRLKLCGNCGAWPTTRTCGAETARPSMQPPQQPHEAAACASLPGESSQLPEGGHEEACAKSAMQGRVS